MKTSFKESLRRVINASGRMTKLGVSTQSPYVIEMMKYGAENYFVMDELYKEAGAYIAEMVGAKDAVVVSSASAGIVHAIATVICGNNDYLVQNLLTELININRRAIILPMGHNVNYGAPIHAMIESGGGIVKAVGSVNLVTDQDVETAIDDNVAALMYVKSHHTVQKNMISLQSMIEIGKRHNLPVIVDAAAEEDLSLYYNLGADFVIYSGSKAILGPASGFVLCRSHEDAINMRKHTYGIGRSMKIGKENIFGLVGAIEEYVQKNRKPIINHDDLLGACNRINQIVGLRAIIEKDEAGRAIERIKVTFDKEQFGMSAVEANNKLQAMNPSIHSRDYQKNLGSLSFDPRPLGSLEDLDTIIESLEGLR